MYVHSKKFAVITVSCLLEDCSRSAVNAACAGIRLIFATCARCLRYLKSIWTPCYRVSAEHSSSAMSAKKSQKGRVSESKDERQTDENEPGDIWYDAKRLANYSPLAFKHPLKAAQEFIHLEFEQSAVDSGKEYLELPQESRTQRQDAYAYALMAFASPHVYLATFHNYIKQLREDGDEEARQVFFKIAEIISKRMDMYEEE